MPVYRITTPDGTKLRVTAPEGATEQDVLGYAQQNWKPSKAEAPKQTSFVAGLLQGFRDPLDAMAQLAERSAAKLGVPVEKLNEALGMPSAEEARRTGAEDIRRTVGEPGAGGRLLGTLPATIAAFGKIPGVAGTGLGPLAARTAVGTVTGAAAGAMAPVESGDFWTEKGKQIKGGAIAGGIAAPVASGIARMVSPQTRQAAKTLMQEGVTPTPGQILGGVAQRVEEGAQSIPLLGDAIRSQRLRAMREFDTTALNRVLKALPGGVKPLKPGAEGSYGREALESVGEAVSAKYQALLPQLKVQADRGFMHEMGNLLTASKNLPAERAAQLERILEDKLFSRFTPAGVMSGTTMKQAESELGRLAKTYMHSADADQRLMGDALHEALAIVRKTVERNNPQFSGQLKAINGAYANLLRIERATSALGAKEGVFSPAQLQNAVKAMDPSKGKRAFARGGAMLQDLSEAGETVLGAKVPDSGTPFRAMVGGGLLGGAGFIEPTIPMVGGALAGLYTRPGQNALAAILARRPVGAPTVANALRRFAGPSAALAAPVYPVLNER